MAEISLNAYLDKVDALLRLSRPNEVIAHSRQILKTYPKNLRVYRALARALQEEGRWDEGAEVLGRRLGAEPNDFETHLRLAQCCQQLDEAERAIWHAERALDHKPSDREAAKLLRELYLESRRQRIERLQLTAGAQARQQIRNNLLHAALDTLAAALERMPRRIDLQLLRARTLWLDGQRMDAAETAVDILERLPYAIDANRIMAELWLAEQRPSDAKVYLRRIEELDPALAHQLATGERTGAASLQLDELEASQISPPEADGELPHATAGLEGLLPETAIDALCQTMETGEAVAETSALPDESAQPPESESPLPAAEGQETVAPADPLEDELHDEDTRAGLDDELARMLEELDSADEGSGWMAEIQAAGASKSGDELEYVEEFEREWVRDPASEESGAPWIAAALREAIDEDDSYDLFGEDGQLRDLLDKTADTQPIDKADIADWLGIEREAETADEGALDLDEDELMSPPAPSWLDDKAGEAADASPADSADLAQPQPPDLDLIDSWDAELGEDLDDDPYVDWLSEDSDFADDELRALAEGPDGTADGPTADTAGDWEIADEEQLADFVEEAADEAEGAHDWMNALVPGLDRAQDAEPDDPNEFAQPIGARRQDYAWVTDIVEEETGEMKAVGADEIADLSYYRFSQPPAWLAVLQAESGGGAAALAAPVNLDENIEALDLDALTFDDYFTFDTPTDKLDVISLDEDTEQLNFAGIDWDDYFDLESPTEKTIAITLDEEAAARFNELGVDDDDFDFETATDKMSALSLDEGGDPFSLGDLPPDEGAGQDKSDTRNRGGGQSTV